MMNLMKLTDADPEGGRRERTPTLFCTKFFKKSPELTKKSWGRAPEPPAPPPF